MLQSSRCVAMSLSTQLSIFYLGGREICHNKKNKQEILGVFLLAALMM